MVVEAVEHNVDALGMDPKEATYTAMREVSGAIVATAFVLLAVFLPVAFLSGITGVLYKQFALSIVVALSISAVVAMLLLTLTMREAMIMYNSRGLTSYKQLFETLYHPFDKIEWAFEVFFYIMVLMAVAAAISGAAPL